MDARLGLNSGAPTRSAPRWSRLALPLTATLMACLAAGGATAQTGTGSTTSPSAGTPADERAAGMRYGPVTDGGPVRGDRMAEPALAQQDQHWGTSMTGPSGSSAYTGSDYSWIPYTRRGYVGLSLGNSDYDTACGPQPLSCDDRDQSLAVYTGGMFNEFLGLEIGGKHFGKVSRAGGEVRAYGANISLVGMVDMDSLNLYLKAGALYGHTRVSADPMSGVHIGTATGWGPSATIGIGFNVNRNFNIALERSRDRFDLPGGGRTYVESTALALKYRF